MKALKTYLDVFDFLLGKSAIYDPDVMFDYLFLCFDLSEENCEHFTDFCVNLCNKIYDKFKRDYVSVGEFKIIFKKWLESEVTWPGYAAESFRGLECRDQDLDAYQSEGDHYAEASTSTSRKRKSEKRLAFELQREELQEKMRRLEEDRHTVDMAWGDWGPGARRARPRSRRKPVTVSGPCIVYMLEDQEIMEDWTLIRKILKRSSP